MFRFDPLHRRSGTAQVFDFIGMFRMFRLFRFQAHVRQENRAAIQPGQRPAGFSFYTFKWNKWNSGTYQSYQWLSMFRIVPLCSAFAAHTGNGAP